MRKESEVKEKFDEIYLREMRKKLSDYLTRSYVNCKFNTRFRVKGNGMVGFCQNPVVCISAGKPIFVCSDDGVSKKCECFECKNEERSVEREFIEEISSPSLCGQKYPKLAVLLWFLQKMPNQENPNKIGRLRMIIAEIARLIKDVVILRWW